MAGKDFLEGYVEVKDRIAEFYSLYGNGRLVTDQAEVLTAPDGKQRVMVRALAYRSPDDPLPAVGYSWMELPGTTNYTRGSELENTETSAIGRAIGFLGILVDKSIASANEIRAKGGEPGGVRTIEAKEPTHEATTDGGLIGIAAVGEAPADYELRMEEGGEALSFKLMDGRKGFRVVARDNLAIALSMVKSGVIGQRVICWGQMGTASFPKGKTDIKYAVLELSKIQAPEFYLPAAQEAPAEPPVAEEAAAEILSGSEAAAPSDTSPSTADAAVVTSAEPTAKPSAPRTNGKCGAASPYGEDVICGMPAGHLNRANGLKLHRLLDPAGQATASWPA